MFVLYLMCEILNKTFIWEIGCSSNGGIGKLTVSSIHVHHDQNQIMNLHGHVKSPLHLFCFFNSLNTAFLTHS